MQESIQECIPAKALSQYPDQNRNLQSAMFIHFSDIPIIRYCISACSHITSCPSEYCILQSILLPSFQLFTNEIHLHVRKSDDMLSSQIICILFSEAVSFSFRCIRSSCIYKINHYYFLSPYTTSLPTNVNVSSAEIV